MTDYRKHMSVAFTDEGFWVATLILNMDNGSPGDAFFVESDETQEGAIAKVNRRVSLPR